MGGIALVLGAVFFLSLAFTRGWITNEMRVVLGLVGGVVLMILGPVTFDRHQPDVPLTVFQEGIGQGLPIRGERAWRKYVTGFDERLLSASAVSKSPAEAIRFPDSRVPSSGLTVRGGCFRRSRAQDCIGHPFSRRKVVGWPSAW